MKMPKVGAVYPMAYESFALRVTPADVGDRAAVVRPAEDIQDATGDNVRLAYLDQGYMGEIPADAAAAEGIALHVVRLPQVSARAVFLIWLKGRNSAWHMGRAVQRLTICLDMSIVGCGGTPP
jgi:hypothetical protein